jgi:hypothetical protein
MRNALGIAIAIAAVVAGPAGGAGMSRQEYREAKKQVEADYLAERRKCGVDYGPRYKACLARAHGMRDVANAELEAKYKPSPRHYYDAAVARATSAFNVAKTECEEKRGEERKACKEGARAEYDRAIGEAKTALAQARVEAAKAGR